MINGTLAIGWDTFVGEDTVDILLFALARLRNRPIGRPAVIIDATVAKGVFEPFKGD